MIFEKEVQRVCNKALIILETEKIRFRPMKRIARVNLQRGFVIGRTNLRTGLITIDILTPIKREPKKMSSILNTLCHEVAHHQKKPFRQLYRFKWITRQHYPEFYKQITINLNILKKHPELGGYF